MNPVLDECIKHRSRAFALQTKVQMYFLFLLEAALDAAHPVTVSGVANRGLQVTKKKFSFPFSPLILVRVMVARTIAYMICETAVPLETPVFCSLGSQFQQFLLPFHIVVMLTSYHWRDSAMHWVSDGVLIRETLARVVTIRGDLHVDGWSGFCTPDNVVPVPLALPIVRTCCSFI